MQSRLKILIVEDVPSDAELAQRELQRAGIACEMMRVETRVDFLRQLEELKPDLIISDFSLPEFDGKSALALAKEKCPETPFIFLSGTIGEEVAVESLKGGATDYILKKKMIDKGFVNDDTQAIFKQHAAGDSSKTSSLKWGLIIFFAGLALIIMEYIPTGPESPMPYGLFAVSVSLGFLLYYFMVKKDEK